MELPGARSVASRDRILRCVDQLPPFSPIINRLLARLAKENVSFAELAQLVEKDTVLAASILRLVNSALYGFRGTINSVPHAISIIGLQKLTNTVLAFSLARVWRHEPSAKTWSAPRFHLHSVATAVLSDLLVQYLPVTYPEGAFTAGLFHDIGKLLIATALPAKFEAICSLAEGADETAKASAEETIGVNHAELSAAALAHWNLPLPIRIAAENHHEPEEQDGSRRPLSLIIHRADQCVNSMGITVSPVRSAFATPEESLAALGLEEKAPQILGEFASELEFLRSFF